MANALGQKPLVIDTDFSSFRTAASVSQGIRPYKIVLAVGSGSSSAGNVTITGSDGITLYPPLAVAAGQTARTILFTDDPTETTGLTWKDFAVTGVTATGTVLYIWYRV